LTLIDLERTGTVDITVQRICVWWWSDACRPSRPGCVIVVDILNKTVSK